MATFAAESLAVLAGLVLPLVFTVVLAPFRTNYPNTDTALTLMLIVVGVAASGYRLAGIVAAARRRYGSSSGLPAISLLAV